MIFHFNHGDLAILVSIIPIKALLIALQVLARKPIWHGESLCEDFWGCKHGRLWEYEEVQCGWTKLKLCFRRLSDVVPNWGRVRDESLYLRQRSDEGVQIDLHTRMHATRKRERGRRGSSTCSRALSGASLSCIVRRYWWWWRWWW